MTSERGLGQAGVPPALVEQIPATLAIAHSVIQEREFRAQIFHRLADEKRNAVDYGILPAAGAAFQARGAGL